MEEDPQNIKDQMCYVDSVLPRIYNAKLDNTVEILDSEITSENVKSILSVEGDLKDSQNPSTLNNGGMKTHKTKIDSNQLCVMSNFREDYIANNAKAMQFKRVDLILSKKEIVEAEKSDEIAKKINHLLPLKELNTTESIKEQSSEPIKDIISK